MFATLCWFLACNESNRIESFSLAESPITNVNALLSVHTLSQSISFIRNNGTDSEKSLFYFSRAIMLMLVKNVQMLISLIIYYSDYC